MDSSISKKHKPWKPFCFIRRLCFSCSAKRYFHWKALRFKNCPQMPNVTPVRSEKPAPVPAWGDQLRSTRDLDAVVLFYPEGLSVNRHSPVIVRGFMEAVQRSVTKPQLAFTLVTVTGTGVWLLFCCSGIFKGFRFGENGSIMRPLTLFRFQSF